VPYSQSLKFTGQMTYELRAAGDPLALTETVERIVGKADRRIPVSNVVTQVKRIDQTIGQERTFATLCTRFSVLASLIACVGLYGTMAYSVARRTNEIGIRMALGAERGDVLSLVVKHGIGLTGAGVLLGLIGAVGLTRFLKSLLYGVQPIDWGTFLIASAILSATALLASYIPARRAAKVDPMVALRYE